jgi:hypothetical protein
VAVRNALIINFRVIRGRWDAGRRGGYLGWTIVTRWTLRTEAAACVIIIHRRKLIHAPDAIGISSLEMGSATLRAIASRVVLLRVFVLSTRARECLFKPPVSTFPQSRPDQFALRESPSIIVISLTRASDVNAGSRGSRMLNLRDAMPPG